MEYYGTLASGVDLDLDCEYMVIDKVEHSRKYYVFNSNENAVYIMTKDEIEEIEVGGTYVEGFDNRHITCNRYAVLCDLGIFNGSWFNDYASALTYFKNRFEDDYLEQAFNDNYEYVYNCIVDYVINVAELDDMPYYWDEYGLPDICICKKDNLVISEPKIALLKKFLIEHREDYKIGYSDYNINKRIYGDEHRGIEENVFPNSKVIDILDYVQD